MNWIRDMVNNVLDTLDTDTIDTYGESQGCSDVVVFETITGTYTVGYQHNGKTLTHDIFVSKNGHMCAYVTGDIRADREALYKRAYNMLRDTFHADCLILEEDE